MPHRINIPDPAGFLGIIAGLYENATRVFMEYIDNSLDDAGLLFVNNENAYPRLIKIDDEKRRKR